MKLRLLVLGVLLNVSLAHAIDADFLGYLRGGTGVNFKGGKQECFFNAGLPGNFLRLGNECSFYSELGVIFHHKKADTTDPVFFRTQVRIQYGAQGTRQWEAAANRDINQVEAFVTAGGFSEIAGNLWVGKRFYRDVDLNIFDWYYYADMSGVGAGIENVPLGSGQFSLAHLVQTSDQINSTAGKPALQALDLRWKDVVLSASNKIHFWGVYASAPASHDATNSYKAAQGGSIAARLNTTSGSMSNNASLMLGQGVMKDFNIYGSYVNTSPASANNDQIRAWNIRFVDDWHKEVEDRWAMYLGIAAEYGDTGASDHSHREWQAVGIRPIYFVTDRFQWVFESGYSRYKDEGEKVGERNLARFTIAPQVSLSKSIWGRPVLRAFVSYSQWNGHNKTYIAKAAPSFVNQLQGTSFGYQYEAWF